MIKKYFFGLLVILLYSHKSYAWCENIIPNNNEDIIFAHNDELNEIWKLYNSPPLNKIWFKDPKWINILFKCGFGMKNINNEIINKYLIPSVENENNSYDALYSLMQMTAVKLTYLDDIYLSKRCRISNVITINFQTLNVIKEIKNVRIHGTFDDCSKVGFPIW